MGERATRAGWAWLIASAVAVLAPLDVRQDRALTASGSQPQHHGRVRARTPCQGARDPLPDILAFPLRHAAFPEMASPSVAVHVPAGFDATRRAGLVVYFHGWGGSASAALSHEDVPVEGGTEPLRGDDLAAELDAARVNAVLVAVELRPAASTGEVGALAMPGELRALLRVLLEEHLAGPLGCTLDVDDVAPIILMAHSGGYQAVAAALEFGDLPQIAEVDLLDALYGASNAFVTWMSDDVERFDPRLPRALRFVDLYTCCGGTMEPSRGLTRTMRDVLGRAGLADAMAVDEEGTFLRQTAFRSPVIFGKVAESHSDVPRTYFRDLLRASALSPLVR